jgi:hypothetical protein
VRELIIKVVAVVVVVVDNVDVDVVTVMVTVTVASVLENIVEVVTDVVVPTVDIVIEAVVVVDIISPVTVKKNTVEDGPDTGELMQSAPRSRLLQKVLSRVKIMGSINVQMMASVGLLTQIEVVMAHWKAISEMKVGSSVPPTDSCIMNAESHCDETEFPGSGFNPRIAIGLKLQLERTTAINMENIRKNPKFIGTEIFCTFQIEFVVVLSKQI